MDYNEAIKYMDVADEQIKKARLYHTARIKAAEAKIEIDTRLAAGHLTEFRAEKKNLGYELAVLMLLEKEIDAIAIHAEQVRSEAEYRGLEKLLEAFQGKISLAQSIMKFQQKGEIG